VRAGPKYWPWLSDKVINDCLLGFRPRHLSLPLLLSPHAGHQQDEHGRRLTYIVTRYAFTFSTAVSIGAPDASLRCPERSVHQDGAYATIGFVDRCTIYRMMGSVLTVREEEDG
jgi:hypothetical protein